MIFNILIFLFILGVLIFVHEFGHFLAARICGVRVEKFAFGFGPPLIKVQLKDTLLLICAIPLGGYIKMAGDEKDNLKGAQDEFGSKSVGKRAKIVFFGPLFNLILSFLIFCLIFFLAGVPSSNSKIGDVLKYGPTAKSEFSNFEFEVLTEEKIIEDEILDVPYALWGVSDLDRNSLIALGFDESQASEILGVWKRSIKVIEKSKVDKELLDQLITKNIVYEMIVYWNISNPDELREKLKGKGVDINRIIYLLEDSRFPAFKAGLQKDDIILSINNKNVKNWTEMSREIKKSKDEIVLNILRGQDNINVTVVPQTIMVRTISGQEEISVIGISAKLQRFKFIRSFIDGGKKFYNVTSVTLGGIGALITRKLPFKEAVSGPIGIGVITSKFARAGIMPLLELVAILSLSLGLINLFPIPVLDGGHLLFMGIEKICKKPISAKLENILTQAGMYALLTLMVFVTYNDVVKFSPRKKGLETEYLKILKTNSMATDMGDDSPYAFWITNNDKSLNDILDKNSDLDKEKVIHLWNNSFKITEVLAGDE